MFAIFFSSRYSVRMPVIRTKNIRETQRIARDLAKGVRPGRRARVVALSGELGAGKTAFAQGFARALGVKSRVLSPTFVVMKVYPLHKKHFTRLVHIDCYRLHSSKDLITLGIKDMLKDPQAVVLIEWPERVKNIIPRDAVRIHFSHGKNVDERRILYTY